MARARVRQDWGRDAEIGLFPSGRRVQALPCCARPLKAAIEALARQGDVSLAALLWNRMLQARWHRGCAQVARVVELWHRYSAGAWGSDPRTELLDFFLNGRERQAEAFGRRSFLVVAVAGGFRTAPTRARPARLCP